MTPPRPNEIPIPKDPPSTQPRPSPVKEPPQPKVVPEIDPGMPRENPSQDPGTPPPNEG